MHMNKNMTLAILAISILLSACGVKDTKKDSEITRSINEAPYVVIENKSLTTDSASINGIGSIVFVAPLSEDANNFHLNFDLEDGGSLSLVSGSDNKLQQGLALTLSREGKNIIFETRVGETSSAPSTLSGVDGSAQIALNIDVHNDETPAHVLIWKNGDSTELLMDSEESIATAGNGQSNLWGLDLKAAKVTRADLRNAAHEE